MPATRWLRSLGVVLAALLALPALSQEKKGDLADRSLEDLMNTQVTSVSKREQKLSDAAAAIFVITHEDIRRSGASGIPDLLRMVPGVEVAQINGNSWAISIRGFNSEFATKLLVLIDGRSVYSPLFSGVYWDVQDTLLEDVERIEVIRGPGATVWGANAVNGVINIITKGAAQTQGGLIAAASGNQELGSGAARYGGKIGEKAFYRAFIKYFDEASNARMPADPPQNDSWQIGRGGFRMDWQMSARDSLTVEGDVYGGVTHDVVSPVISFSAPFTQTLDGETTLGGGNVLARWTRTFSSSSDMALQFYFDRTNRNSALFGENRNTYDLDFQHHLALGVREDIVWGVGYRRTADDIGQRFALSFDSPQQSNQLFSLFAQDEIKIVPHHLFLTIGSKVEHNDFTGFEIQPNVRLLWTPTARQALWGAVSRAVRTPSRAERAVDIILREFSGPGGIPTFLTVSDDPKFRSEDLLGYELGYRFQPTSRLSLDIATYYNAYTHLSSSEQGMPVFLVNPVPHVVVPITLRNKAHGETYGVEFAANWNLTRWWKLSPGYSWLREGLRLDPSSTDAGTVASTRDNPNNQFQLRSSFNLPHRVELDSNLYYVGGLANQVVPAYTRFDVRLGWRPNESAEVSGVIQNAFQPLHQEFGNPGFGGEGSLLRRSAYVKLVWRF